MFLRWCGGFNTICRHVSSSVAFNEENDSANWSSISATQVSAEFDDNIKQYLSIYMHCTGSPCLFPYWRKLSYCTPSLWCCIQEIHSLLLLLILGRTSTSCKGKNQCPCFFCAELIRNRAMVAISLMDLKWPMLLVKICCISLNCNGQLYFMYGIIWRVGSYSITC